MIASEPIKVLTFASRQAEAAPPPAVYAAKAAERVYPGASYPNPISDGGLPAIKGARCISLENYDGRRHQVMGSLVSLSTKRRLQRSYCRYEHHRFDLRPIRRQRRKIHQSEYEVNATNYDLAHQRATIVRAPVFVLAPFYPSLNCRYYGSSK